MPCNDQFNFAAVNMVANYYKPGPATSPGENQHRIVNPSSREEGEDHGKWYVAVNVVEGYPEVSADNWNGGVQPQHRASLSVSSLPCSDRPPLTPPARVSLPTLR